MKTLKNLILVGGGSRNLGKTEFVTGLIKKFKFQKPVIGIKIKTLYPNDSFFHGNNHNPLNGNYRITKFSKPENNEDTSRMLRAGAEKVFKIKSKIDFLGEAFHDLLAKEDFSDKIIVCESNSLRDYVVPALFIIILSKETGNIKPSAKRLMKYADKIVYSDGKNFDITPYFFNFTY